MITVVRADAVLIQDRGRLGFADQGVPVSGAWDRERYEQAAALVESEGGPVFELLAGEFSVEVDRPTTVAVVGPTTAGPLAHSWMLPAGGRVDVKAAGTPVYVAFAGLVVPKTLGSSSTDLVSLLGPPRVERGQSFSTGSLVPDGVVRTSEVVRAIGYIGQQLPTDWKVISQSRSGTRIEPSVPIDLEISRSLPSRPMLPGVIQIVSPNEAIVLGPDSGVTGGYAVGGVVVTGDLARIARLAQDEHLVLDSISPAEALRRYEASKTFSIVRV